MRKAQAITLNRLVADIFWQAPKVGLGVVWTHTDPVQWAGEGLANLFKGGIMEQTVVSRNQLINQLIHIGHKDLSVYTDISLKAVSEEPELFAHLIAWNNIKGEVRDSKVAFPTLALRGDFDNEYTENAVAHLLTLDPRNLLRAVYFHRDLNKSGHKLNGGAGNMFKHGIRRYLQVRETNRKWFDRTALQHRKSLKALYAVYHVKPSSYAQKVLFERQYPKNSVFTKLALLKDMNAQEAAGTILNEKIPFLIATGALGGIKGKSDLLLALIERMSGAELINNTNMLKKAGVFENPALKAAYDNGLERAKKDKKLSTLKASKAAEIVEDKAVKSKLRAFQEEKIDQMTKIEGDWLVLGDRSGSMDESIEIARKTASHIARMVEGQVHLVFFNTMPMKYDVTGKTLDEINHMTRSIRASGGTSIGCGLELLRSSETLVNGIVICSDGGDNTYPLFHGAYSKYVSKMGIEPTVYHFWMPGERDRLRSYAKQAGLMIEHYDVTKMDDYSLPNLIQTLRSNRYTLVDDIMNVPLMTIKQALQRKGAA
jgi:hypothetical protein